MKWGPTVKASDAEVAALRKQDGPAGPLDRLRNGFNGRWDEAEESDALQFGANPGDVWTIPNQPYAEAHFATYPEELVRRVLLATCPREICTACGTPRRSVMRSEMVDEQGAGRGQSRRNQEAVAARLGTIPGDGMAGTGRARHTLTGYSDCGCNADWKPGVVLDPFGGSGTTGLVAAKLGLGFTLIELNREYVGMMRRRLANYLAPLTSFDEPLGDTA